MHRHRSRTSFKALPEPMLSLLTKLYQYPGINTTPLTTFHLCSLEQVWHGPARHVEWWGHSVKSGAYWDPWSKLAFPCLSNIFQYHIILIIVLPLIPPGSLDTLAYNPSNKASKLGLGLSACFFFLGSFLSLLRCLQRLWGLYQTMTSNLVLLRVLSSCLSCHSYLHRKGLQTWTMSVPLKKQKPTVLNCLHSHCTLVQ